MRALKSEYLFYGVYINILERLLHICFDWQETYKAKYIAKNFKKN